MPVYQCEDNLGAICHSGTCTLVNTGGECVGDCSGNDSTVTIDEVITMVNIALGNTSSSACPGVEAWCNSGLGVTVDCIILAVLNALDDCGISGLGGPCGGNLEPRVCAPGLICQYGGVPDVPGTCVVGPTPTATPTAPCTFECVGGCCDFDGARQCYQLVYGSDAAQCIYNDHGNVVGCCGGVICNSSTGRCEAH